MLLPDPGEDVFQVRVADLDGNGTPDLVAVYEKAFSYFRFRALLNRGDGTFVNGATFTEPSPFTPRRFALGDFDDNGRKDLLYFLDWPPGAPGHPFRNETWIALVTERGEFAPTRALVANDQLNPVMEVAAEERRCRGASGIITLYLDSELGIFHQP